MLWRDISRYVTLRQMRFPHQFIDDVQALVLMLIKDIVERYIKVCNSETRFPHQFIDDVQALVLMLIKDIVERYIKVCNSETDEISAPVYR